MVLDPRAAVWSHAFSIPIAVSSFLSIFENPAILQQRPAQGLAHMDKHSRTRGTKILIQQVTLAHRHQRAQAMVEYKEMIIL